MYEPPSKPDIVLRAGESTVDDCVQSLVRLLEKNHVVPVTVINEVCELYVPRDKLDAHKEQAEYLKSITINKVDMQWVQVRPKDSY